jgi:hypothetical protein
MPYLLFCAFTESSSSYVFTFKAYSSTDPDRSGEKVKRDVFFQLGYQECYPNDKHTIHGHMDYFVGADSVLPLDMRGDVIKCVIRSDHMVNMDYPPNHINGDYEDGIAEGHGHARPIEHIFVQPNLVMDALDDSDDSDSDSSDSD